MATAADSFEQGEVRDLPAVQSSQLIDSGIAEAVRQEPDTRKLFAHRLASPASSAA